MTQSLEDYLEMVSFLADEGEVRVTDIAARLGVSKPSVLTALRILEDQGLLEHARYGTVTLTAAGADKAAEIRGRHDLLTAFLIDLVGVSPRTAEKDACKMEHLLSVETLDKIRALVRADRFAAGRETAGRETAGRETAHRETAGRKAAGRETARREAAV